MSFSLFKMRHCDTDSETVTTRYVKWPDINIYIWHKHQYKILY